MPSLPPLADLGRRIMVMGPTNAGKSTLAAAIARRLSIPAVHVDRFRHLPDTDWRQRPDEEFVALHAAAIAEPAWVMDGNYTDLLPARFARATGAIVIDDTLARRYCRYFWRTMVQKHRHGGLEGRRDSVKWAMIHWLWHTRNSAEKYRRFAAESGLPAVFCRNQRELDALYAAWGLARP